VQNRHFVRPKVAVLFALQVNDEVAALTLPTWHQIGPASPPRASANAPFGHGDVGGTSRANPRVPSSWHETHPPASRRRDRDGRTNEGLCRDENNSYPAAQLLFLLHPAIPVMKLTAIRPHFLVSQALENLQHLAPRREHPPASLLVSLHGPHEFHLVFGVVVLTDRRIGDSPPPAGVSGRRSTTSLLLASSVDDLHGDGRGV